ncbi:MAG: hypothetical protein R2741_12895 [Methanolobus sp.]
MARRAYNSFQEQFQVMKCDAYDTGSSDKRSRSCFYSTKRSDAIYMLQSEFNVSITVAEKLIDTLVDMGITKALDDAGSLPVFCDEGCRILAFEEDL